jgi:hypothetical protein
MKRLLSMLAPVALTLGAAVTPASADVQAPAAAPMPEGHVTTAPASSYQCCWVFIAGRWYCIPC